MKNFYLQKFSLTVLMFFVTVLSYAQEYPDWTYGMKIFPFDILYPFNTAFANINGESNTSDSEIRDKLNTAKSNGANVVIFYIDNEQSYETFVDDTGFNQTLNRIKFLVQEAHNRNLKVVCYLNGLEAVTVGATTNQTLPSLARNKPDWIQIDITGKKMVWYTTEEVEWIPENSEDAWVSPLSPWRDFFKQRLISLSTTGLDGVYIDASFLPGVDSFGIKWASSDTYFQDEFQNKYGLSIPTSVDWNSENWRKFIYFRHEVIRNYLGELADVARSNGMIPFFESSSCDLANGTYLANDISFTISGGIACSPEIEPEGDYFAAFRMSKATRDANQNFPMWFLGWPETSEQSRREFAVTLCHSGNYYPTADSHPPTNAFHFIDLLKTSVLDKRIPFQNTALIYPMRSKDYSFQNESTFDSYNSAFETLAEMHIPFRILTLETMTAEDLTNINNIVLAGAESISDEEYNLIKDKIVALIGVNGTKDKWGNNRSQQLTFANKIDISDLAINLPFTIKAPTSSYIEYYRDKSNNKKYYIFLYSNDKSGEIIISDSSSISGKVYEIDNNTKNINGTVITIPIVDYLEVVEVQLSGTTDVNDFTDSITDKIKLDNYPNPFNPSTKIKYQIPKDGMVNLKIYDITGQEIVTLVNQRQTKGNYEINFDASNLKNGIYLCRLKNNGLTKSMKMILLK